MDDTSRLEDFVKRIAASVRTSMMYAPTHPLSQRTLDAMCAAFEEELRRTPQLTIGFLGDDVIVGRTRLRGSAALAGLVRHFRDLQVEKLSFNRGVGREQLRGFVSVAAARDDRPFADRLAAAGLKGVGVGVIDPEEPEPATEIGVVAARQVYSSALTAAQNLWRAAQAGEEPDPAAAHAIIDTLSKAVSKDRTSMMALTSLKSHDPYTFTHMVNVSLLTMAQARALGLAAPMVREFGLAGLMHDVGKTRVPTEILNKPGRLSNDERSVIERHVVDGAQILRKTPGMPALAAVVAFEHHLKQDLSGYPADIGSRTLNLCTMLVSIADVFDALRFTRAYRDALPANRVRHMLHEQSGTAFEPTLLRRFISLMGIFPVGTLVRLVGGEVGVVTEENPSDPYRPQVKVVTDTDGVRLLLPMVIDTAARNDRGEFPYSVLEAVDDSEVRVDPAAVLAS
jgi:putative nucleotidyltransferase with HDIG domain